MAIKRMELAGKWVIKNLDGEEKRFDKRDSPAALEWMRSRSTKKPKPAPKYSQEYWDNLIGDKLTPMDHITEDDLNAPLKKFLDAKIDDFSIQQRGYVTLKNVRCATVKVRCVLEYSKDDDLGNDGVTEEGVWVQATRDPQDPKKLAFKYTW